jgi:hypothetical protein
MLSRYLAIRILVVLERDLLEGISKQATRRTESSLVSLNILEDRPDRPEAPNKRNEPDKPNQPNEPDRASPTQRIRGLRDRSAAPRLQHESKVNSHARPHFVQMTFCVAVMRLWQAGHLRVPLG